MKRILIFGLTFSVALGSALCQRPLVAQDKADSGQKSPKQSGDQESSIDELMEAGQVSVQAEDWSGAAKAFQKVVDREADNAQAWLLLGFSLHNGKKLEEAIQAHRKASEFEDVRPIALYNLGCAYSLKNDLPASLKYLHQAVSAGFTDRSYLDNDSDLENVRKEKGFEVVVARAKNNGKDPTFDSKKLVGEWKMNTGTLAGNELAAERLQSNPKFDKEKVTIPAGGDPFVMSYKLNLREYPVQIDLNIESGPVPEGKALGILKMEGNRLLFCYDPQGTNRPETFESTADNGFNLFEMELVPPADKGSEKTSGSDK